MTAALRSPFNLSAHLRPTVGDQKISYTGVDHMGWLKCDGRQLTVADYGLLFGVIGYTFGGSGDSFYLPDFRGTVPGIAGSQSNFSGDSNPSQFQIGDKVGEQKHQLTRGEMPAHTHGSADVSGDSNGSSYTGISGEHFHYGITDISGGHVHSYSATYTNNQNVGYPAGGGSPDVNSGAQTLNTSSNGNHQHTFQTSNAGNHAHFIGSTGGDQYHNNMQPTLFGGNMFIYSGKNMQAYFPYTWVGGTPGNVLVY